MNGQELARTLVDASAKSRHFMVGIIEYAIAFHREVTIWGHDSQCMEAHIVAYAPETKTLLLHLLRSDKSFAALRLTEITVISLPFES